MAQTTNSRSDTIRCFIAIEIENSEALDKIQDYQAKLQKSSGPLKLVKRDLMHLTLRFLGNISYADAKSIYQFIQTEVQPLFDNSDLNKDGILKGAGDFNRRTFIINIDNILDVLQLIHSSIEQHLKNYPSIQPETRPYTPHLTIARAKKMRGSGSSKKNEPINAGQISYSKLKQEFASYEFGKFTVRTIILKKSVLTPRGPIYSNLKFPTGEK